MKFGPFTVSMAKSLTATLEEREINFTIEDDKDVLESAEKSLQSSEGRVPRGASYDPAFIFITLDPNEIESRAIDLVQLGLVHSLEEPDFSKEDFVCPTCGKQDEQGENVCATHKLPLIPWSEYMQRRQKKAEGALISHAKLTQMIIVAVILICLYGVGVYLKLF